jgi:hypothetical protein
MLSEAGHKEAAEAAKRAEQSTGRDLSAEAAKLKEQHRDGAGPANAGDKKHEQASSGVSVLEGEGTKEEGAFLVHATRGKTRCTVAASPDSTVTKRPPPPPPLGISRFPAPKHCFTRVRTWIHLVLVDAKNIGGALVGDSCKSH